LCWHAYRLSTVHHFSRITFQHTWRRFAVNALRGTFAPVHAPLGLHNRKNYFVEGCSHVLTLYTLHPPYNAWSSCAPLVQKHVTPSAFFPSFYRDSVFLRFPCLSGWWGVLGACVTLEGVSVCWFTSGVYSVCLSFCS